VLMIYEDVQWVDPTTLELLALIVERAQHMRLLLVISARPEFTPPRPTTTDAGHRARPDAIGHRRGECSDARARRARGGDGFENPSAGVRVE
jgi:hypothetical protein